MNVADVGATFCDFQISRVQVAKNRFEENYAQYRVESKWPSGCRL